jgi:septal ring-binding cell division protein DamX
MADTFPVSGNIEPASFPHLLVDLHRHGATGSLKVNGPQHPKHLYFRGGRIVFGSSKDPRDQLGEILIEGGKITREQLDEVNAKIGPGNPLAKVLAESGFVNNREIQDAARVKLVRILADVLSWDAGSFEFEDGVLPKSAVDLKIPTERLILDATQRIPDRSFALRHVTMDAVLEPVPGADAPLAEVGADVSPLLDHLDGRRTLKEAIALTRFDEFEAAKTACAMLFLGIARKKEEAGREVDLAEEAQSAMAAAPPAFAPAAPAAPVPEPTGFSFSEPEVAPGFPAVEPLPEPVVPTETVAFGLPPAQPEPPPFVEPERAPEPFPEVVPAEAAPAPEPQSFQTEVPWARKPSDTVPGDQPVYTPPAPEPAPPSEPSVPNLGPAPAPASRPTREDLAALDALLSPSASQRLGASPLERPRPELSQRVRPPTTPPRRLQARPVSSGGRSRVPLIAVALACILLTSVVAWYFLLRSPKAPGEIASASPAPAMEPEASTPAPSAVPTVEPTVAPTSAAAPPATPQPTATTAPAATPVPTPPPTPRPATPRPTPATAGSGPAQAAEARSLLAQGALPEAARAFAAEVAPTARGSYSLQVLVACDPANVQKALSAVTAPELFILPVNVKGKACYRLCWGVYDGRPAAEAALSGVPSYFRQGGLVPRLSPLAELLP